MKNHDSSALRDLTPPEIERVTGAAGSLPVGTIGPHPLPPFPFPLPRPLPLPLPMPYPLPFPLPDPLPDPPPGPL